MSPWGRVRQLLSSNRKVTDIEKLILMNDTNELGMDKVIPEYMPVRDIPVITNYKR